MSEFPKFKGFCQQWFATAFKKPWQSYGHLGRAGQVVNAILLITATGGGIAWYAKYQTSITKWIAITTFSLFLASLGWSIITTVYDLAKKLFNEAESNIASLNDVLNKRAAEVANLKEEIEKLKTSKANEEEKREKRSRAEFRLSSFVHALLNRQSEIKEIHYLLYDAKRQEEERQKTEDLLNRIKTALLEECGIGVATQFLATKIDEKVSDSGLVIPQAKLQIHIHVLEAYREELKRILDRFIERT